MPDPTGLSACGVSNTLASTAWKYKTPWVVGNGNAREANDHVGIDQGTIVQMTYVGTTVPENVGNAMPQGTSVNGASLDDVTPASGAVPWYIFTYNLPPQQSGIPIHDHRDNFSGGGFAFAVFHPGTAIPQQPWAI